MIELERWMGENVLQEKDFEYAKDFVCQGFCMPWIGVG